MTTNTTTKRTRKGLTKAELEKNYAELTEKFETLLEMQKESPKTRDDSDIRPDEYITVMSMISWRMNLSTLQTGRRPFSFSKMFEKKRIMYKDLVEVMENHPTFTEYGYFYILDKRVVRRHGLDEYYEKILDEDKLRQILDDGSDTAFSIFETANSRQKENIARMLVTKISNGENVDKNLVYAVSDATGVDILKNADETKKTLETAK